MQKIYSFLNVLVLILIYSFFNKGLTENTVSYRIGFEQNRKPFSYMDDYGNVKGIIVNEIKQLCENSQHPKISCSFLINDLPKLLDKLERFELDAVVKLGGSDLSPKLISSSAICRSKSVVIHSENYKDSKKIFSKKIALQQQSYLKQVSTNQNDENLQAYSLLEAAVFDLVFDRVDAILASQAFFIARVENLKTPNSKPQIVSSYLLNEDIPVYYKPNISMLFSNENIEKYSLFELLLQERKDVKYCYELLS